MLVKAENLMQIDFQQIMYTRMIVMNKSCIRYQRVFIDFTVLNFQTAINLTHQNSRGPTPRMVLFSTFVHQIYIDDSIDDVGVECEGTGSFVGSDQKKFTSPRKVRFSSPYKHLEN